MIIGIGVDIVDLDRIQGMIDRHGKRFLGRTFTDEEIAYCLSRKLPTQHFAARFAAKEAAFKAFGTGWRQGLGWKDVEVRVDQLGQPHIYLSGRAAAMARDMGITDMLVSLSHCTCHAIAHVVACDQADS
ncbi:MAG: holo-ACP synthase [Planctomycetes bacterium]|nr:holo-ACP synthase [Planctomycetota bacterium]